MKYSIRLINGIHVRLNNDFGRMKEKLPTVLKRTHQVTKYIFNIIHVKSFSYYLVGTAEIVVVSIGEVVIKEDG